MKKIFSLIAILFISLNTFCHKPDSTVKTKLYHVNYPVVGSIIGVGIASDVFAISRIKGKANISPEELVFLNSEAQRNLIHKIDRWALRQKASGRTQFENISNYGMTSIILLPGLLAFDKDIRKDWFDLLLMYTEGHSITFSFYNYSFLGPTFQNRYRPMTYYSDFTDGKRMNGNNRNSFYSGHIATCTFSTFFMAKVYCDYHPDICLGNKILWYAAASVPPALMGYVRVRSLDHFPSDCAFGFALGAVIGIVVPQLHKYHYNKKLSFSMFNSPDANGLTMRYKY